MFGILKDKLAKAVKAISDKFKAKEEEKEEPKPEAIQKELEEIKKEVEKKEVKGVLITYFVHGTTKDNENGIATGWAQGELSDVGLRQAKELGETVANKEFDIVFSSDLKRAVDSANLAFGGRYRIVTDGRLREVNYGDFTQKPSKEFKGKMAEYVDRPFPNGESYKDVEKRIAEFLNHLHDNYYGKRVAIVAHQAPQLALEVLLNGKTWEWAINEDWRARKEWQPGWDYELKEKIEPAEEKPKSFISKIFEKAVKTVTERKLEEKDLIPVLGELEADLIEADVAVEVAERIKSDLLKGLAGKEIMRGRENEEIVGAFKRSLLGILDVPAVDLEKLAEAKKPAVLLFLGFNGSGKTTSIAKVANFLKERGRTSVLAAGDSWRAAAIEQLEEHGNRIGVKVIKHNYGSDPAAVVYDAVEHAKSKGVDFVLADSAGRVHTNQNLMQELQKMVRVNKPDLKVLIIDSMTGNDALEQARAFGNVGVDAVIFTKVDVNEKGGAILSVTNELKKPILFLGTGQGYGDFERFDAERFVSRILG